MSCRRSLIWRCHRGRWLSWPSISSGRGALWAYNAPEHDITERFHIKGEYQKVSVVSNTCATRYTKPMTWWRGVCFVAPAWLLTRANKRITPTNIQTAAQPWQSSNKHGPDNKQPDWIRHLITSQHFRRAAQIPRKYYSNSRNVKNSNH